MAKIALIANPMARRNRKKRGWMEAQRAIVASGQGCTFIETHSLDHLREVLPTVVGQYEVIAISGGDGSVHSSLTHLYRAGIPFPKLHYIPSGTMNMLATSLSVDKNLKGLNRCVREPVENLRVVERDTMCVNERYIGFLFGTGLVANFLNAYYEMGGKGGPDAARLVGRFAMSVMRRSEFATQLTRPEKCQVTIDGQVIPLTQITAAMVQTIANLGIGFKPMYRAETEREAFHALVTDLGTSGLLNRIPLVFRGGEWNTPRMHDLVATSLQLTYEHETHMQVDGEIYETPATINVQLHEPVTFVQG